MITLTYPDEYPEDWRKYKAHLRAFRAQLERKFDKLRVVWRLEYQKRGAPHYHLLVLDPPFIEAQEWSRRWNRIIKSDDQNHAKIGVDVKPIHEWGDRGLAAFYVAKYTGKTTGLVEEKDHGKTGRHWGYWNIEKASAIAYTLDFGTAEYFSTVLYSSLGNHNSFRPASYASCAIMGDSMGCDDFAKRAEGLLVSLGAKRTT